MELAGKPIGDGRAFLVAEAGVNHGGDMEKAVRMMKEAKWAGADAIKFQHFDALRLSIQRKKSSLHKKLLPLQITEDDVHFLFSTGEEMGIPVFFTAFDAQSAKELPTWTFALKIGSSEAHLAPSIASPMKGGQPVIVSFGQIRLSESRRIRNALEAMRRPMIAVACKSEYPCTDKVAGEKMSDISYLRERYGFPTAGWSDHTKNIISCVRAASSHRACYVEKHIMLRGDSSCIDADVSVTPEKFREMALAIRAMEKKRGSLNNTGDGELEFEDE